MHVYFKHQLLDEWRKDSFPNLTYKVTLRPPLTEHSFDVPGISLSVAMSKVFGERWYLLASGSLAYQNLKREHFNSQDRRLVIQPWSGDLFLGLTIDIAKLGGWHVTLGHRFSSRRIYYLRDNPADKIKGAQIEYLQLSYLHNKKNWEFNLNIQEDLFFPFFVTEPDFLFHGSVLIYGF